MTLLPLPGPPAITTAVLTLLRRALHVTAFRYVESQAARTDAAGRRLGGRAAHEAYPARARRRSGDAEIDLNGRAAFRGGVEDALGQAGGNGSDLHLIVAV